MYISYMFNWLFQFMQIKLPIVFSKNLVFSLSIFQLFIGACYLYLAYIVIKFFLTGVISYEKASLRTNFVHKYESAKNKVSEKFTNSKKGSVD